MWAFFGLLAFVWFIGGPIVAIVALVRTRRLKNRIEALEWENARMRRESAQSRQSQPAPAQAPQTQAPPQRPAASAAPAAAQAPQTPAPPPLPVAEAKSFSIPLRADSKPGPEIIAGPTPPPFSTPNPTDQQTIPAAPSVASPDKPQPPPLPGDPAVPPPLAARKSEPPPRAGFPHAAKSDETFSAEPVPPTWLDRLRQFNYEEVLGTQVFLKLGVFAVVVGMVFFLGYAFNNLGPIGKISIGYGLGLGMIGFGLWREKKGPFGIFWSSILAGGWGLLYATSFAMHYLPTARLIQSPFLGILLLLATASACVAFSLRYKKEWTTFFAYLLIFASLLVAVWELETGLHLAGLAIAATSLYALCYHFHWSRLYLLGSLASWLSMAYMVEWAVVYQGTPINLWVTLFFFGLVWLVGVTVFHFWRDPELERGRVFGLLIAYFGLMSVSVRLCQTLDPHSGAWFLLACGLIGLALALRLYRQGQTLAFRISASCALICLALVSPLRLGMGHDWTWLTRLLGLELLFIAAALIHERFFRWVATFLLWGHFLVLGLIWGFGGVELNDTRLLILAIAGLLAVLDFFLEAGPLRQRGEEPEQTWTAPTFNAFATLLLVAVLPKLLAPAPAALILIALGVIWVEIAQASRLYTNLRFSGPVLVVWALHSLVGQDAGVSLVARLFGLAALYWAYFRSLGPLENKANRILSHLVALACSFSALVLFVDVLPERAQFFAMGLLPLIHFGASRTRDLPGLDWSSCLILLACLATSFNFGWTPLWLIPASAMGLLWWGCAYWAQIRERSVWFLFGFMITAIALFSILAFEPGVVGWGLLPLSMSLALCAWFLSKVEDVVWTVAKGMLLCVWWMAFIVLLGYDHPTVWTLPLLERGLPSILCLALAYFFMGRNGQNPNSEAWRPVLFLSFLLSLALTIKVQALRSDFNVLVGIIWMTVAVAVWEGARRFKGWEWPAGAGSLLLAGAIHCGLVNLQLDQVVAGASVRVWTCLPAIGLLVWAQFSPGDSRLEKRFQISFFHAAIILLAMVQLFSMARLQVIWAWSLVGLGGAALWFWRQHPQARWASFYLTLAVLVRVFAIHFQTFPLEMARTNLWSIPLAATAISAGYVLMCLGQQRGLPPFLRRKTSFSFWYLVALAIWIGFVKHETAGTTFTIWLSLVALGSMVAGFLLQDRVARLAAMGLLLFCVFKLFLYDLRWLHGLWRILSFMVLGGVLILVSYSYTRFRDRWSKFL
ncbi:MAG: DUF2339 domain-containing protein [Acidobacteria bacterium]|nr:DUF2339 domain-containing protein [Acidobacteriota bacterium]